MDQTVTVVQDHDDRGCGCGQGSTSDTLDQGIIAVIEVGPAPAASFIVVTSIQPAGSYSLEVDGLTIANPVVIGQIYDLAPGTYQVRVRNNTSGLASVAQTVVITS